MAHTIEDSLSIPCIRVLERNDESGHFCIALEGINTAISISLGRERSSDKTKFTVSHAIKTPLQAGPYNTSIPVADYWEYALYRAITGLTQHYEEAVNSGHKPKDSWLVPNKNIDLTTEMFE